MERKLKTCGICDLPKVMWKSRTRDHPQMCKECSSKSSSTLIKNQPSEPIQEENSNNSLINSNIKSSKPKEDKSIPELLKLAEIVFNKWIRRRDRHDDMVYFTCISCNKDMETTFQQCGHYMPSKYSSLRFNEDNCNSECEFCNCGDDKHLIGYRKNLIHKIGLEKVEWLESHKIANTHKWDKQELLEIISKYK